MKYEESMRELGLFNLQKTRLQEDLLLAIYNCLVFEGGNTEEKKRAGFFQICTVEAQEANDPGWITGEFDCIRKKFCR